MSNDIFGTLARNLGFSQKQGPNPSGPSQPMQQPAQNNQQFRNPAAATPQQQEANNANGGVNGQPPGDAGLKPAPSSQEMFADLWKDKPADPNAPKDNGKLFNTDMDAFGKAVDGMDFTQGMPPDLMQKALGGDGASMQQLLNLATRKAFSHATLASSQMVEHAFAKKMKDFEKMAEEKFNTLSTRSQLRKANPAFNDPAIKPLVNALEEQIRSKYPDAAPEEVTDMAQKYFTQMASKLNPVQQQASPDGKQHGLFANSKDGSFDWMEFAEKDTALQGRQQ